MKLNLHSDWRPLLGWIAVGTLAAQGILIPLVGTLFAVFGHTLAVPLMSIGTGLAVLASAIAVGVLRTVEKMNNVHGIH